MVPWLLAVAVAEGVAATAEETDLATSNLLLKEEQQFPVPVASQQKPPSGITESWHSTTNFFVPKIELEEVFRQLSIRTYPCRMMGRWGLCRFYQCKHHCRTDALQLHISHWSNRFGQECSTS